MNKFKGNYTLVDHFCKLKKKVNIHSKWMLDFKWKVLIIQENVSKKSVMDSKFDPLYYYICFSH